VFSAIWKVVNLDDIGRRVRRRSALSADMAPASAPLRIVLVGVDGSPGAARVLDWAIAPAGESGASVLLVHVLTYSTEFRRDLMPETFTTWRKNLDAQLRHQWARPAVDAGVPLRCELVEDDSTAAGLLRTAEQAGVDSSCSAPTATRASPAGCSGPPPTRSPTPPVYPS
jgi:nucleotide-binding universal stress UspA family protein